MPYASLARSGTVKAQDDDSGRSRLRWPRDHGEAVGHGNFLGTVHAIGDDAAPDAAADAEHLAPELLAVGRIERIEVAAEIAEEHHAAGGWGDGAENGVVGFHAPLPNPSVGVG